MKDRCYVLTTVHKAPIGNKNKVFLHHEYGTNRKDINRKLAELVLSCSDIVGASVARVYRNNMNRENSILKVAKKIIKEK